MQAGKMKVVSLICFIVIGFISNSVHSIYAHSVHRQFYGTESLIFQAVPLYNQTQAVAILFAVSSLQSRHVSFLNLVPCNG